LGLGSVSALDSVRISGFRSLVEFEQANLPTAFVLDGANGSGKTNLIRFLEVLSHGLRDCGLGECLKGNGVAHAQLHCGHEVLQQIWAEIGIRPDGGRIEYRFSPARAESDRLMLRQEACRSLPTRTRSQAPRHDLLGEGNERAGIAEEAASSSAPGGKTAGKTANLRKSLESRMWRVAPGHEGTSRRSE